MTALMITHNMTDALTNGDRLLIFNDGRITQDFSGEEKPAASGGSAGFLRGMTTAAQADGFPGIRWQKAGIWLS